MKFRVLASLFLLHGLLALPSVAAAQAGGVNDGTCQPDPGPIAELGAVVNAAAAVAAKPYDIHEDPNWADMVDRMRTYRSKADLSGIERDARSWRKRMAEGQSAPSAWDVHWAFDEISAQVLAEIAKKYPDPPLSDDELGKMKLAALRRSWSAVEHGLSDPDTRKRLADGGQLERFIIHGERLRQEIERRMVADAQGRFPDGLLPKELGDRMPEFLKSAVNEASWQKGLPVDLGNGWEVQLASPGVKEPKLLLFSQKVESGKTDGKLVIVRLEAKPKVLRLDYHPSKDVKGGVDVLVAKGAFNISSRGADLEASAALVGADLTVGPLTVKGYAGGLGLKLKFEDGKFGIGAIPGVGGAVEVDLLWIARATYVPEDQRFPPTGPRWVSRPTRDSPGAGYYALPSGTTVHGSTRAGADYALGRYLNRYP